MPLSACLCLRGKSKIGKKLARRQQNVIDDKLLLLRKKREEELEAQQVPPYIVPRPERAGGGLRIRCLLS